MAHGFIVTGEASGDAIGAEVAAHLKALRPGLDLEGIGAARMADAGVRLWANSGDWAAIGIAKSFPVGLRLVVLDWRLRRYLAANRPDVLVLVDFGAFNVRLGIWARENGIRTVYLMPSGSWRRKTKLVRLQKMARSADLFLTPFAWNADNLRGLGAQAVHIGHPVLDMSAPGHRSAEIAALRVPGGRLIALLPGSRGHEVETLVPLMRGVVRSWPYGEDRFVMVRAPSFGAAEFDRVLTHGAGGELERIKVTDAPAADVFAACDLALVCSGTATLEAAVAGTPMVVVYDGPLQMRMEWRIRRRYLHIEHVAMPNIIAGKGIVREFIAEDASVENATAALRELCEHPDRWAAMRDDLLAIRHTLEPPGALRTAAEHIIRAAGL